MTFGTMTRRACRNEGVLMRSLTRRRRGDAVAFPVLTAFALAACGAPCGRGGGVSSPRAAGEPVLQEYQFNYLLADRVEGFTVPAVGPQWEHVWLDS
jgi:hypothetical protein